MHYNVKLCQGCNFLNSCEVLWGEACRNLGGTKIPRVRPDIAWKAYHAWQRADEEEQARQQAVRDQLRAEEKPKGFKPYWMERLAKVVGR